MRTTEGVWASSLAAAQPGELVVWRSVNSRAVLTYEIVSRGSKLVTAREAERGGRAYQYRIENGAINDQYGHSHISTKADDEAEQHADEARRFLRERGIEVGWRSRLTPSRILQLRELVDSWGDV